MPQTVANQDAGRICPRRRTFAIVSHPDAGKTTLTEKFLLYGGAVQLAGSVTARKQQRATTSDWMELEKKRGISISSTVLQFDYRGTRINLLDTPGHKDFSEDTYRVLTAVDSAIMVIDAASGIESQTRKLFEVCRQRRVPVFTFINKMDRPARDPLDLLDELESVLGLEACPMNWPLGSGFEFKGVWDRMSRKAHLFERTPGGARRAPVAMRDMDDPFLGTLLSEPEWMAAREEVAMLDGAGAAFDAGNVLAGKTSPVYFGSALNNFGVQLLLDGFVEHAAPPAPRPSRGGLVDPRHEAFSGFVFKIQANMNPRHRDRIAFVRVVSGRFEREMSVVHAQSGRRIRMSNAALIFGRERETVEEAYPGDILGLVVKTELAIGDTLTEDPSICYDEIPCFAPECFSFLENPAPSQFKRFRAGVSQLLQEGVLQAFRIPGSARPATLLGAVGPLQFEIFQYRLRNEYGAESRLESAPWTVTRWIGPAARIEVDDLPTAARLALDGRDRQVLLFPDEWNLRFYQERHPDLELRSLPFPEAGGEGG